MKQIIDIWAKSIRTYYIDQVGNVLRAQDIDFSLACDILQDAGINGKNVETKVEFVKAVQEYRIQHIIS